ARRYRGPRHDLVSRGGAAVTASRTLFASVAIAAAMLAVACGTAPGQPRPGAMTPAPAEVVGFATLVAENCAGCHGADGRGGAALSLANPIYLAIVDDRSVRSSIAVGVRGTSMPAFAQRAGGMLTDGQIDALVNGIRSLWARPGVLDGASPPS